MSESMLAYSPILPTFLEGTWKEGRKERGILWESVSEDVGGGKKEGRGGPKMHQHTLPVPAEFFANQAEFC